MGRDGLAGVRLGHGGRSMSCRVAGKGRDGLVGGLLGRGGHGFGSGSCRVVGKGRDGLGAVAVMVQRGSRWGYGRLLCVSVGQYYRPGSVVS